MVCSSALSEMETAFRNEVVSRTVLTGNTIFQFARKTAR